MPNFEVQYRAVSIMLTCAVAFIGAYAAVASCEQIRIASMSEAPKIKHLLLVFMSLCAGGVCTWGVFYVAMSSYRLYTPDDGVLAWKTYDTDLVLTSLVAATALKGIGFYIASKDVYFGKSESDIIKDIRHSGTGKYIAQNFNTMSKWQRWRLVCFHRLDRIVIGGVLSGTSFIVMWQMGIASINIPGGIKVSAGPLVAHAFISVIGNTAGYWMSFRLLSVFPSIDTLRFWDSISAGIVLPGVVYIALAGVTFEYDPSVHMPEEGTVITSVHLIIGVLIGTIMFSFVVIMYVLSDLRSLLLHSRTQLRLADRALLALTHNASGQHARQLSPKNRLAVSPSGKHFTTAVQRNTQAPAEVVQYTRQYLKTLAERSDTHPAVFTYRHRLFYDVDPDPPCTQSNTEPASLQLLEGDVEDESHHTSTPFLPDPVVARLEAIQTTEASQSDARTADPETATLEAMSNADTAALSTGRGPVRLPALHYKPLAPVPEQYRKGVRFSAATAGDDM
jgi:NO-binding membrane sensor protein with MHYT domain